MSDVPVVLVVPEIRDYHQINKELVRALNEGAGRVVLAGVESQRLLASGLRGGWTGRIEVEGRAGPELGADLDAPGLTIVVKGSSDDGLGRGLRAGRIVVEGDTRDGVGYAQRGGSILVMGSAGHRAGLRQAGGRLMILGSVGRLSGDAQKGGLLVLPQGKIGPHAARGCRGGRRLLFGPNGPKQSEDLREFNQILQDFRPWLSPAGEGGRG